MDKVKEILDFLKDNKITGEDKTLVISALLENIDSLPINDTITFDERGTVLIAGKELTMEQSISFRESIKALKDNFSRKIILEQLKFQAIQMGIHKGLNAEMIMFAKACLYNLKEEEKLISKLDID